MKITFTKRDDSKNAMGVRLELDSMTEVQVKKLRAAYVNAGWKEGTRTRKLSNAELSARTHSK